MNIFGISAEKANYVPQKINATSVSPNQENPHGATAKEIANGILDRKLSAAIPLELGLGIADAKRTGNTEMLTRGMDSFNNLWGSTLLRLQDEAEEGSLMLKLINERLAEFKKEFGEPIPNYTPFIPPNTGSIVDGGMAQLELGDANEIPLTLQELAFAKAFKIYEKRNEGLRMMLAAMESGDEAKKAEARELRAEARRLQQEHSELFSPGFWGEFFYALHGKEPLTILDPNSFTESRARHGKTFQDLPQGGFSFSEFANALLIGMGSKIPMGHFNLHVYDNTVGAFQNHVSRPSIDNDGRVRSVYTQALNWLLHASQTGNSSLNTSHSPFNNDSELNRNVLSLLEKMGVDTSREFSINGTTFHVRNGRVETQGYTPFVNPNPVREYIGAEGMRKLLARAMSQS
ncbi:MAG: hypothetical protein FWB96_03440 [Defluviitaleaceae bacterium]|nr:hypothetical protein [Defluviitaleaceae bacterium]MCL2261733.1 hypothetical protein [Defluviitaleaceae bacterium]